MYEVSWAGSEECFLSFGKREAGTILFALLAFRQFKRVREAQLEVKGKSPVEDEQARVAYDVFVEEVADGRLQAEAGSQTHDTRHALAYLVELGHNKLEELGVSFDEVLSEPEGITADRVPGFADDAYYILRHTRSVEFTTDPGL